MPTTATQHRARDAGGVIKKYLWGSKYSRFLCYTMMFFTRAIKNSVHHRPPPGYHNSEWGELGESVVELAAEAVFAALLYWSVQNSKPFQTFFGSIPSTSVKVPVPLKDKTSNPERMAEQSQDRSDHPSPLSADRKQKYESCQPRCDQDPTNQEQLPAAHDKVVGHDWINGEAVAESLHGIPIAEVTKMAIAFKECFCENEQLRKMVQDLQQIEHGVPESEVTKLTDAFEKAVRENRQLRKTVKDLTQMIQTTQKKMNVLRTSMTDEAIASLVKTAVQDLLKTGTLDHENLTLTLTNTISEHFRTSQFQKT